MSLFDLGVEITVITRTATGEKDAYGNATYGETMLGPIMGLFDPAVGFESTDARDQVTSQPQALLPATAIVDDVAVDVEVTSYSVLLIAGDRYEVDGVPHHWRLGSEWDAGWQVPLKRAVG